MFESNILSYSHDMEAIIAKCDSEVRAAAARSQARHEAKRQQGIAATIFGTYEAADEEGESEIGGIIRRARAEADAALSALDSAIQARVAEEPYPSDLMAVNQTISREQPSRYELEALLSRYGSNYQLRAAINDKMTSLGYPVETQHIDLAAAGERADAIIGRRYFYQHNQHQLAHGYMEPREASERVTQALQHLDAFGNPTGR